MLRELHPDRLWAIEEPFRFGGLEIGARLIIARRSNGDLWIHAPFEVGDLDEAAIRALGEVRDIVVPNNFHFTQVGEFARRFPEATVWAPSQLKKKLQNVPHRALEDFPAAWNEDFEVEVFRSRLYHEWAFCHRASRTLILTDLALNLPRPRTPRSRIASRLADVGRGFKPTRLERVMLRTGNRAELQRSLKTTLQWDFERITIAHGEIVDSGGKTALRRAYRWLLK